MPKMVKKGRSNRYTPYIMAARKAAPNLVRAAAKVALRRIQRKRRAPKLNANIAPVGTGSSLSFFRRRYKAKLPHKVMKALAPVRTRVYSQSEAVTSTNNAQGVTAIHQLACDRIAELFSGLVDGTGAATQSMLIRSIEQEIMISNASSTNTFLKIYECTARNDFFSNTAATGTYTDPIWTGRGSLQAGLIDVSGSTAIDADYLGMTPFQSKLFTQLWNVNKIFHVELGAGRSHKHQTNFAVNKMMHEERTSRNSIVEYVTRCVLIVAYGSPVNSTADRLAVGTSKVSLNVVWKETIKVQSLSPQASIFTVAQNLGNVFTTGEHMDEDGDAQAEATT